MKSSVFILLLFLFGIFSQSSPQQQGLIARYPLNSNPNDTTGNHGPMTLINTPFEEGGIYCNGVYIYSGDSFYCQAITPQLSDFNFQHFTIQVKFKVLDTLVYYMRPVFVGGDKYRWVAFNVNSDGTVSFLYNNNNTVNSSVHYLINTWHEATITYDAYSRIGKFYLDTTLAGSVQFHILEGNDRNVSITNFSNGFVFRGLLSDLRIYSTVLIPTGIKNTNTLVPEEFTLSQNYPNPFNPGTKLKYSVPYSSQVQIKVFDVLSNEIETLVNEEKPAGTYELTWNAEDLPSGVYFYQLSAGEYIQTKKMILLK